MSTAITDQVRVRLVFVTHPTCPECRPLQARIAGTQSVEVLDWSKPDDRAEVRRLRAAGGSSVAGREGIALPLLLACSHKGACKEWVGPASVRRALTGLGV
jgi:hypothetical protein